MMMTISLQSLLNLMKEINNFINKHKQNIYILSFVNVKFSK